MRIIDLDSVHRKIDKSLLKNFGFVNNRYEEDIMDNNFKVVIEIKDDKANSYIIDNEFGDEYTNVDINTVGEFVSTVKDNYESIINNFVDKCTIVDFNYHDQVKEIINYINNKYHDNIEYLWESTPDSGIFRNKKNKKWYAAILSVKEDRVGGKTDKVIMVIDLMHHKGETFDIIDNKSIYPGYHMNKNSWITIRLDGSQDNEFIYKYIDLSYELSLKK